MSVRPLVVRMIVARFAIAGATRSSRMQSTRFGRKHQAIIHLRCPIRDPRITF